jgi:hypothetical protein
MRIRVRELASAKGKPHPEGGAEDWDGGHHGLPDFPQDVPIDVGSKGLKSKGFSENVCHVFDKEREGKGEEVQSFA